MSTNPDYGLHVFINCPLDLNYRRLFRAIVFAILECELTPRCALERMGGHLRLDHIIELVRACKFGIHDLSRTSLSGGQVRFNMPFELGVFLGATHLGANEQKHKVALVLTRDRYSHQQFISDLAGVDVSPHGGQVAEVVRAVRNWIATSGTGSPPPYANRIATDLSLFTRDLRNTCRREGRSQADITFRDLVRDMTDWINIRRVTTS